MDEAYETHETAMDGYVWTRSRYKIFLKNWGIPVILEAGYHIIQNIAEVYIDEISQAEKIADLQTCVLDWMGMSAKRGWMFGKPMKEGSSRWK